MEAIRVLVVDDHEIVRIGVRSILASQWPYAICDEAEDGRAALAQALRLRPDLVVMDIGLRVLNGLQAADRMLCHNPRPSVLMLTEIESEGVMRAALEIGIRGFILKSDPACDLLLAAEALLQRRTFFTRRMTEMVLGIAKTQRPPMTVTDREREVIQLVAEGNSSRQIAKILGVSERTVETHRRNVMRNLKVRSTADLILYAVRNAIVHVPQLTLSNSDFPAPSSGAYSDVSVSQLQSTTQTPQSQELATRSPV